jgi:hypothetical protein
MDDPECAVGRSDKKSTKFTKVQVRRRLINAEQNVSRCMKLKRTTDFERGGFEHFEGLFVTTGICSASWATPLLVCQALLSA